MLHEEHIFLIGRLHRYPVGFESKASPSTHSYGPPILMGE